MTWAFDQEKYTEAKVGGGAIHTKRKGVFKGTYTVKAEFAKGNETRLQIASNFTVGTFEGENGSSAGVQIRNWASVVGNYGDDPKTAQYGKEADRKGQSRILEVVDYLLSVGIPRDEAFSLITEKVVHGIKDQKKASLDRIQKRLEKLFEEHVNGKEGYLSVTGMRQAPWNGIYNMNSRVIPAHAAENEIANGSAERDWNEDELDKIARSSSAKKSGESDDEDEDDAPEVKAAPKDEEDDGSPDLFDMDADA